MTSIDISFLNKVESTNDYSINLIKKNISIRGIVFSDIQTNGRGRRGNYWISNKGNVFCSIYKKGKVSWVTEECKDFDNPEKAYMWARHYVCKKIGDPRIEGWEDKYDGWEGDLINQV